MSRATRPLSDAAMLKALPAHLSATYGFTATGFSKPEPWNSGVLRCDRADGPSWIARMFPAERPLENVEGDVEILRYLEAKKYPSERVAAENPISTLGGRPILVTLCAEGKNGRGDQSAQTLFRTGELTGRLHALPKRTGAASRPAGCWHGLSVRGGTRKEDVAVLKPLLTEKAESMTPKERKACAQLIEVLEGIDLCEDLPHALINIDLGGPNVLVVDDGSLTVVDWTDAGWGPRIHAVNTLLAGGRDPAMVDVFVAGYRKHCTLEPEELDRLGATLPIFMLVLGAWDVAFRSGKPSQVLATHAHMSEAAQRIAARAKEAFAADHAVLMKAYESMPVLTPMQQAMLGLRNAIAGMDDAQLADVAKQHFKGWPEFVKWLMWSIHANVRPEDCSVAFFVDGCDPFRLTGKKGKISTSTKIPEDIPATVRTSPAMFARAVAGVTDWTTAIDDGLVYVDGDEDQLDRLFASER